MHQGKCWRGDLCDLLEMGRVEGATAGGLLGGGLHETELDLEV